MSFDKFERFTLKQWEEYIKCAMMVDEKALLRALVIVFKNQTYAEKSGNVSLGRNKLGFNRVDADILSKAAKCIMNGVKPGASVMHEVKKRMPKYWRQVMEASKRNIEHSKYSDEEKHDAKVEIIRHPTEEDWARCKMLALNTIGKEFSGVDVSEEWKHKMLEAEHSPIRTLMFTMKLRIPFYVSVHFARHKHGIEHFVVSQRNDRQSNYDRRDAPQGIEVVHMIDVNAQELMSMARRRLCSQADVETQRIMSLICMEVEKACPEFIGHLVPMCEYQWRCPEFKSCGRFAKKIACNEQLNLGMQ